MYRKCIYGFGLEQGSPQKMIQPSPPPLEDIWQHLGTFLIVRSDVRRELSSASSV